MSRCLFHLQIFALSSVLTLGCSVPPSKTTDVSAKSEEKNPVKLAKPDWAKRMESKFEAIDKKSDGNLGVTVLEVDGPYSASYQGDRSWYLASTIKVPVALEVIRQIEDKKLSWDQEIVFSLSMALDGAGQTNNTEPGQKRSIRFLMDQMLIESDNTATDILVDLVGIDNVNSTVKRLVPEGFGPITSLLDVRRLAFSEIHPKAKRFTGLQFLEIRKKDAYPARYKQFVKMTKAKPKELKQPDIYSAFEAFYAKGYNSGTLDSFSKLLKLVAQGKAVNATVSRELMTIMGRCKTGATRLKKNFSKDMKFAHKTGTQVKRICDVGVVEMPTGKSYAVSACVEKFKKNEAAEAALAQVGDVLVSELGQL